MSDVLTLKYDPNTIEHLGVSLYSKLPSVLSELISNSWDADADDVSINFIDNGTIKEIHYSDNGVGMSFDEINDKFLLIGRNRRLNKESELTAKKRKVIGKKGLGKLSVFGICNEIEIISVKNKHKNHFKMNLDEIKKSFGEYHPELLCSKNTKTEDDNGTIIKLREIRRKTGFNLDEIAASISKKFLILDDIEIKLLLNGIKRITVTNDLKFSTFEEQFRWNFPNELEKNYKHYKEVSGFIITTKTPIKDTEMTGIYLVSRGKIVNTASFYGLRDNDQFHTYVTGYLQVDFVDDFMEDVISTDRHSLNWETDETKELQEYLKNVIKKIGNEWKKNRSDVKKEEIKKLVYLDINEWQNKLPRYERDLSERIVNPILNNAQLDTEKSSQIIINIIDQFENKTFKEYADRISEITTEEQFPEFLELINDWKVIEAKEIKGLADARIEVIKQFERYLASDTKEVPVLHEFLKKFSWLLDPRILEFRDEVRYSTLLKETYPEEELDEKDRRIDFLCSNALGEILYVIEIKRSQYEVDHKALEQAYDYGSFLREKFASESGFASVVCFVVGGKKSGNRAFKDKEKTYMKSGEVFVKTYTELLEQTKNFHKEFIEAYK